ncbi:CHAP domain-containing protein, partial [Mycobacterium tuberculosis]|nr:CHAP domain-containing protein [Mycobacterium tuberculosis]
PGLQRFNPGSGYVPVPGDLIVEHGTASNRYGHVAIVDRVEGNNIVAIEQNGSANGWHVYSYNGSSYAGGYGAVKAIL